MKNSLLLSVLLLAGTSGAFGDSIFISPASQDVSVGQTFSLDINVDNIPDLYDYQFSLSFNPQVLAAQSITEGALFAKTGDSFFSPGAIDNGTGSIVLTFDTLIGPVPGVAGPGTLAVAQFSAIAAGTSTIDFSPLSDLILEDSKANVLTLTTASARVVATVPEPGNGDLLLAALGFGCMVGGCIRRKALRQAQQQNERRRTS